MSSLCHGPLVRYVKLRVARAPGMPGTFHPPPRVSDPNMHQGTCVTHVPCCMPGSLTSGLLWSRCRGKHHRYSRRMRKPQFSPLSEPMTDLYMMYICATRPRWINVILTSSFIGISTSLKGTWYVQMFVLLCLQLRLSLQHVVPIVTYVGVVDLLLYLHQFYFDIYITEMYMMILWDICFVMFG